VFHRNQLGTALTPLPAVVHHGAWIAARQQLLELGPQLRCRLELSVGPEVLAERPVQRARDVAGHRVQRFHFALESRGGAGVDQRLAGGAQAAFNSARGGERAQLGAEFEVGLEVRRLLAIGDLAARGLPRLQPAVERPRRRVRPTSASTSAGRRSWRRCGQTTARISLVKPILDSHIANFAAGQRMPATASGVVRWCVPSGR
jgi:hypothetical protein